MRIRALRRPSAWWSGVVVSALALINEVNQRRARLVLRWATVSGFNSLGARHLFRYVTNQPPKANSAVHPSGVGKWVPASAGKAKAVVHSVSGWTRGVQVWDPLRTRAIPERLRGVFTTSRYTNFRLPYLTLPSERLIRGVITIRRIPYFTSDFKVVVAKGEYPEGKMSRDIRIPCC